MPQLLALPGAIFHEHAVNNVSKVAVGLSILDWGLDLVLVAFPWKWEAAFKSSRAFILSEHRRSVGGEPVQTEIPKTFGSHSDHQVPGAK